MSTRWALRLLAADLEDQVDYDLICDISMPGDPVGYYSRGAHAHYDWKRLNKYTKWKRDVQSWVTGVKRIDLPLEATRERPVFIVSRAVVRTGVHADAENYHKGLVDALFYGARGGDKFVAGLYWIPAIDPKQPGINFAVWRRRAPEKGAGR